MASSSKSGKKSATPKNRKVKKKRTNPVVLLIAIGFGFLFLFGVGAAMVYVLNRPGKVMDLLSVVSGECNWVRGMNLTHWNKYPGYSSEVSKIYTPQIKAAGDEIAKLAGKDGDTFIDYVVIGKARYAGTTTMYVLRTASAFNMERIGSGLPGAKPSGQNTWAMSGTSPGVLANAMVYIPNNKTVVIVGRGPQSSQLLSDAQAGKANSYLKHFNDTARVTARGGSWLVVRNAGALKDYIAQTAAAAKDLPGLVDRSKNATTMGVWCTPGGSGIRVGTSMECVSKSDASEFVKAMKNGPLGKGDESEPTNELKSSGVQAVNDKKAFSEFMQYATFTSSGQCAYVYSTVSGDANIRAWMSTFNNPASASDEGASFGGGGPMFGPAMGAGGGAPAPGPPGGIAPPGMAGPR